MLKIMWKKTYNNIIDYYENIIKDAMEEICDLEDQLSTYEQGQMDKFEQVHTISEDSCEN